MPTTIGTERLMSIHEAAEHLEIGTQHVRALIREGRLAARHTLFGRAILAESVLSYHHTRGPWRPGGVVGGNPARKRLNLTQD